MTPSPTTELKDQTYISVTAWLIIILTGVSLYFTAFNLVKLHMMASMQADFFSAVDPLGEMRIIQEKIVVFYYTLFVFCIIGLMSGIGILKRRRLGKMIFTILFIVGVIGIIAAVIYVHFYIQDQFLEQVAKVDFSSVFSKMLRLNLFVYGLFAVIVARTIFRAVLKLNSKAYKQYFE